ncbi:hypothetical protein [Dysgonomonas sp. ZJ709]|uniref:hypothetical protein n=1 Tax=Dysgonomonas sp. ZJ709 TaxID=2709797 RepID=UPI0013ECFF7F|nr:hypothetical protein [Dysgonomonas sp. ZJ709]
MKNKIYIILIVSWIALSIFLLIIMKEASRKKSDQLSSEYPSLSIDSMIIGVVSSYKEDLSSIPKGALNIKLDDGRKFRATAYGQPNNDSLLKNNIYLISILEKGDSIYKPIGKDSLIILRDGKKYTFYCAYKEKIDMILNKK